MHVVIDIPDEIARKLDRSAEDWSRHLLELIVADAYDRGRASAAEVGQILQLPNRLAVHSFLKRMGVYLNYNDTELERDLQTLGV